MSDQFEGYHDNQVTQTMVKPQNYKVHYHNNGTGRDSYIGVNSGGFNAPYVPYPGPPVGSFQTQRKSFAAPMPQMHAKPLHYHSDGTGRDRYIGINEGGLAHNPSFVDWMSQHKKSLRNNPRSQSAYKKRGGHELGHSKKPCEFTAQLRRSSVADVTHQGSNDLFSRSQYHFMPEYYKQQNQLKRY